VSVLVTSLVGLLFLTYVLYEIVSFRTASKAWHRKWPAISDEEFLRQCGPGIDASIALKVREILSDAYGIDEEHIHPQITISDLEE
jgi:hypothetical protein